MSPTQIGPNQRRRVVGAALIVVAALASVFVGYCGYRHYRWSRSIAQFETHGGSIEYESIAPQWLQDAVGSALLDKIPFLRRSTGQYLPGVELSPDGLYFVSSKTFGHEFSVWRMGDASPLFRVVDARYTYSITEFSPDGDLLVVQRYRDDDGFDDSAGEEVRLWSVPVGELVGTIEGDAIWRGGTSFHPDGKTLAVSFEAAENDYELHLWNVDPLELRQTITGHQLPIKDVALSPDSLVTVAFEYSGEVRAELRIWDRATGRLRYSHEAPDIRSAKYSPDGKKLLVRGQRRLSLSDAASGRVLGILEALDANGWNRVERAVFLSDGAVVVALRTGTDPRSSVCVSAMAYPWPTWDGISEHQAFEFVDLSSGKNWEPLENLGGECSAFDATAGGRLFAAGCADGSIKLWDVTRRELTTIPGHDDRVSCVDFSDDGMLLAAGCRDGTVGLYDVTSGNWKTLSGHSQTVTWVGFINNHEYLASACYGGIFASACHDGQRVWDLSKGIECATLVGTRFGELSPDRKISKTGWRRMGGRDTTLWDFPSGMPRPFVPW